MRLIDADELKKALNTELKGYLQYLPIAFNDLIDNAPTVEERPHGKWITNYVSQFFNPGRSCSLCNKTVEFSENFCPNCGADMRGGAE